MSNLFGPRANRGNSFFILKKMNLETNCLRVDFSSEGGALRID
ncbi:hypothetical protein C943_00852 [Mariniradius saccharolyticus AK6]|uniref:Uncharacterized protein n=1 Tax=Mariniradius saccharolyticus AK6 TaxID=1239962 RepID=M7Y6J5_9BACT|nr:hypothetical protein C943_00852 [Mariniradius saccharolyticus AK6]